ncbi:MULTISPECIES: MlaD family protein [Salipiger]|uniref:MlaD family protein n=1 Tax=Salipiger TaxID=263377 RepID=UPI003514816D
METRANYVLIGAFTLAGFLAMLAAFMWFANIQLDRQFAYYDIDFPSVSGLSDASDVRFSGLPVGQVVDVRLSPERDGTVRVRIEIGADTPVRTDSVATIEAQGVTGVSYVGISAGTPEAPLLSEASDEDVPNIEAGQSVLQSLTEDAPLLVSETLRAVQDVRQLFGDENQAKVQSILDNIEDSSVAFAQALDDFSAVGGSVATFADQIDRFNNTLDSVSRDASATLADVREAVVSVRDLSEEARGVLEQGGGTLERADSAIGSAERYVTDQLGPATEQLQRSVADIETRFAALSDSAGGLVETFTETGETATQRLSEARETLVATNEMIASIGVTMESVDGAAQSVDTLIVGDGTALVAELRDATAQATRVIEEVGAVAETDLPAIIADIRSATDTASGVVSRVGEDLSSASGQLDDLARNAGETLDSVRVTFTNANDTLSAINAALETGDRALRAAEQAFQGADRVMNEEVAGIAESLRATLAQLETAVAEVAGEVPGVTEELRAASRSAQAAFAEIETAVGQSAPAVSAFATDALPQFGRLAVETRTLINNLDDLVERLGRDPGRFLLDQRAPEYGR